MAKFNKLQDYNFIANCIDNRAIIENERNKQIVTTSAWNILRYVDCEDGYEFETIINGICNAFNAGYDECNFVTHMWED